MNKREDLTTPATSHLSAADRWATALLQHAARRSPPELSERLGEEWLADMSAHPPGLARLRFALGCCWAGRVISHSPLALGATAQRATTGHGAVAAYAPQSAPFLSPRTLMLLLIIAMHGLLIYGFSNGLGHKVFQQLPPELKAIWIAEPRPIETAPLLTPPDATHWPAGPTRISTLDPAPIPPIQITEDPPTQVYVAPEPAAGNTRPVAHAVSRVIGGPGTGFPSTADFYPPMSRQLGEQGVATTQVCVDSRGHLTKDPEIKDTSGNARLDAGALALAKAGSGHYRSTTEDGQPVSSCYAFRVRFNLK